jgi:hypothetical protein
MRRFCIAIVILMALTGCSTQWIPDYRPETEAEREAVAALTLKLVGEVPHTLSGHDQDWDDVVRAAHDVAEKTVCRLRYYEHDRWNGGFTGRVRESLTKRE